MTSKPRLLLVDDEIMLVHALKQGLSMHGFSVASYIQPTEALKAFQDNPDSFDMIITDMTMPTMLGTDLADQIRQLRPNIPIILCTGHNELITDEKISKLDIQALLMKPFSFLWRMMFS